MWKMDSEHTARHRALVALTSPEALHKSVAHRQARRSIEGPPVRQEPRGSMILPLFRGHPNWRENASRSVHGTKEAKVVHAGVQVGGGAPDEGRRPQSFPGPEAARPDPRVPPAL